MRRRPSLAARVVSAAALAGLLGGCHSAALEYGRPFPESRPGEAVSVYSDAPRPGPVARPPEFTSTKWGGLARPQWTTPSADTPAGSKDVARGVAPDRLAVPETFASRVGPARRPEVGVPLPAALAPLAPVPAIVEVDRNVDAPALVAATIRADEVQPEPEPEPATDPSAAKSDAPAGDDALKPAPAEGDAQPVPEPVARPTPPAPQLVPPTLPPPAPLRVPAKDEGVVVVGGVPVAVPPAASPPAPSQPTPAAAVLPVPTHLPPVPVTAEPPIRPADAPRALPPLTELPPVPAGPPPAPVPVPSTPVQSTPVADPAFQPTPAPAPPATLPPAIPLAPPVGPPAVLPPVPAPLPAPMPVPGAPVPAQPLPQPLPGPPPQPLPGPPPAVVPAPVPAVPPAIPFPGAVPNVPSLQPPLAPGPIDVGGTPLTFDALSSLVDGNTLGVSGGCSACGGSGCRQCAPGKKACEPFPARTCVGRAIGLIYEGVCCPDPCYQPRWEPIVSAAFFVDSPRPVTQTRVRWDYGSNLSYPDRGEFFMPRADGATTAKGPKANAPALGIPALDYHEFYVDQEIATGAGSVTISQPYRSYNPTPFAESAAGFSDMQITAKSLMFDSELFLFAFQMRTYIPVGNFRKGLGTGHLSLEPGVIAGIRVSPNTYAVAQVEEWIPIAGDKDYMGAALRYNFSFNHILWRPIKDVQLVGTWELQGMSFQDGAFTDPVDGPLQKLSGQTFLNMGLGARLFFCDKFDFGAGWTHGITGKALVQDLIRTEIRYRY